MQSAYKRIIYVLLLTISTSSVASTAAVCVKELGEPRNNESVIENAHGNHMAGHHDVGSPESKPVRGECFCCDDCTSICPSVTTNPAAFTAKIFGPDFRDNVQTRALSVLIHESPVPHPLFRPPISIS